MWKRLTAAVCGRNEIRVESPVERQLTEGFVLVLRELRQLREETQNMSASIVTRDQFDQALKDGLTTIVSKIDDLATKVAAGQVTTPEDFSAELALVKSAVGEALAKDPDPAPAAPVDGDSTTSDA